MLNDVPDRLNGFFAPPYDRGRRYFWDLARGGVRQFVASEGRMLLAATVPADRPAVNFPSLTADPPDPTPLLDAPALESARPLSVPVAALLEWCGPEPAVEEAYCEDCGGLKTCECPCCYGIHPCNGCKGSGRAVKSRDPLHGRLLGLRVDRHRLRRLLSTASGQCLATVRKRPPGEKNKEEANFVRLDGDDWTALLMSMEDDARVPCPAFEESSCPA